MSRVPAQPIAARKAGRAFAAAALLVALAAPSLFAQALPARDEAGRGRSLLRAAAAAHRHFPGLRQDGKLAGAVVLVTRRGKVAYSGAFGSRDLDARSP